MTIGTDTAIEFFGTQDNVTGSTSAVTDGSYSVTADATSWTNDDDTTIIPMVLEATYATAPTVGTTVSVYARTMNIQGANDAPVPDANYPHTYIGSFPLDNVTSPQYIPAMMSAFNLASSQVYEFYIKNDGGQTLSAGWDLYVTPKTYGPHG